MSFLLIMPSYNQSHYIVDAIESILQQNDPDWELWIIDNSTDDTPKIVEKYSDSRIKFHHIKARMDPGTCINWALERATGKYFSYVHTDNLLDFNYVSKMKSALEGQELGLAYCDMRVINDSGIRTGVFRRGPFALPRLASLSPLGVPFSATTLLAKQLQGFSTRDVADDVLFCLSAFGSAQFTHIPDALMDYRLHQNSRTTEHGGANKMEAAFLRSYARALPELRNRNIDLIESLRMEVQKKILDLELRVEDAWYRRGRRTGIKLKSNPNLQTLWELGLFKLPDFKPPAWYSIQPRTVAGVEGEALGRFDFLRFKLAQKKIRKQANEEAKQLRNFLLPWIYLTADQNDKKVNCWLASPNVYTIWAAKMMQKMAGWNIYIHPEMIDLFPKWLHFPTALPVNSDNADVILSINSTHKPIPADMQNLKHIIF